MPGSDQNESREKILLYTGCGMCVAWIIAILVQAAFPSHQVPPEVHGVMLVLVPILFGGAALQSRKNTNGGGDGK